jgi:hypothetical protein
MSTITTTNLLLPQAVIANGAVTDNGFSDPNNILLVDTDVAASDPNQTASDITVGNYLVNLPQDAIVTGIEMELIAKRGSQTSPVITLTPYFLDNSSGADVYYPYITPVTTELTEDLTTIVLGSSTYLFNTTWTADKINNAKFNLVANGDISIDSFLMRVYYYIPETPSPEPDPEASCDDCNSPIQTLPFELALPFLAGDRYAYFKSFKYSNGIPIQYEDLGSCGGSIKFTFDPGVPKVNGSNCMENCETAVWETMDNGYVRFDFNDINVNRGLGFHTPYTADATRRSNHDANSQVIISDSGPFFKQYLQRCQVGVVVSDLITVKDEGTEVATPVTKFNFIGDSVQAIQNPGDSKQVDITILSNPGFIEPEIEDTSKGTIENSTTLTIAHTITAANYLRFWISTEDIAISGVTYNGVAMTLIASKVNGPANLKVALYGLINPAAGTHNIVATMGSACDISGGGTSFLDVDTSNPTNGVSTGAIGTSTAPSDTATTTVNNVVMQDVVGTVSNATTFAQAYPWTISEQINAASRPGASSTRLVLGAGAVPDTYTIGPSQAWAIIMAGVRGIAAPSGGVQTVTGSTVDNTDPLNPVVNANAKIQFEDEGSNLGSAGTVTEVDFVGAGVTATRTLNKTTVTIPGGGSASGEVVQRTFTQAAHGFTVGQVLKSSGVDGEFDLAQADVVTNADAIGIVTAVPTVNTFELTTEGFEIIAILPGGAVTGDNLYLSPSTPGALTLTDPAIANIPGTVSFPLATIIDDTSSLCCIHKYRPQEQQSTPLGSAAYTVNADETDTEWFTTEVALPSSASPSVNGWTYTNTPTAVMNGVNASFSPAGSMCSTNGIQDLFIGSTSSLLTYALARTYRIKFLAKTTSNGTPVVGNNCFIGFGAGPTAGNYGNIAVATEYRIGFAFYDDGDVYTIASDFSAITANSQGAFTSSVHEYVIEVENGVSAKFYIDGVLVDTITTDLPASQTIAIAIGGQSATSTGFNFVSNFILSQKLS